MVNEPHLNLSEAEYNATQRGARISILVNGLIYPSWSYMMGALGPPLSPPIHDPVGPRIVVGLLCVLAATVGWRFAWSRNAQIKYRPTAILLVGHQIWLMNENQLAPIYFGVIAMMVPIMAMNTHSMRALVTMLVGTVAGVGAICFLHGEVAPLARLGLVVGTCLACGLTYSLISKHRRAMTALRESEALVREQSRAVALARDEAIAATHARGEFLATVSHEIRTPLNGLMGMAATLLDTPLDATQRAYADAMISSGETLLRILNDLLDSAKIDAGKLDLEAVPFSPRACVHDVVALLATQASRKGVALTHRIDDGVPERLVGDPGRVRQVLLNLVSNAVKFTEQGAVTVSLESTPREGGVTLRCTVRDTGIGMTAEERERLFARYSQGQASTARRFGGTGLGLNICRYLVELMGGRLSFESEPRKGSAFTFEIPFEVSRRAERATPRADDVTRAAAQTKTGLAPGSRVLVVDDDRVNQLVGRGLLRKLGLVDGDIDTVDNGRLALEALQRAEYALVLMDCEMPEMDGLEATRALRQLPGAAATVHVLGVTGRASDDDLAACLDAGMNARLTKPLNEARLRDAIAALTAAPR
jgi:signal transduction histidine kinase/CheY-like chemotaxis protein